MHLFISDSVDLCIMTIIGIKCSRLRFCARRKYVFLSFMYYLLGLITKF